MSRVTRKPGPSLLLRLTECWLILRSTRTTTGTHPDEPKDRRYSAVTEILTDQSEAFADSFPWPNLWQAVDGRGQYTCDLLVGTPGVSMSDVGACTYTSVQFTCCIDLHGLCLTDFNYETVLILLTGIKGRANDADHP